MTYQSSFTDRYRDALRKAQDAARELNHEYVGTEHLLLGVLADSSGEMQSMLRAHGTDPDAIPDAVTRTVKRGKERQPEDRVLPYTSKAQLALRAAAEEAAALRHQDVDLDHLLLALRVTPKCISGEIMNDAGIGADWLRDEVVRRHQSGPASAP